MGSHRADLGGRAVDMLGRRRMLMTGLAVYALASLAGGLATGPVVQLAARAVQFTSTRTLPRGLDPGKVADHEE